MEMLGERLVGATRQVVWDALNNTAVLKECLAGCERLEKTSDSRFEATIAAKVGPVRTTFVGSVTLSEPEPPQSYTISFEGKGGAAGFARGSAKVRLAECAGGTQLNYAVTATLGGKLGQMGSRVIDGVARKMADDFFDRFARIVAPLASVEAPVESLAQGPAAAPDTPRVTLLRWFFVALGLAALAAIGFFVLK